MAALAVMTLWGACKIKDKPEQSAEAGRSEKSGPLKVACLGASNTRGYQLPDLDNNCWPGQLQTLAGAEWQVMNFGCGGATVMKEGDISYWDTLSLRQAWAFEPDVVIIDFGWNDMKPCNRDRMEAEFVRDYNALIGEFAALPSKPRFYIVLPPLYESPTNGIAEKYGVLEGYYRQVIEQNDITPIDLHTPMAGVKEYYIMDLTHYSVEGCGRAAGEVYQILSATL
jgi:lysophospholipase L1-like esterase